MAKRYFGLDFDPGMSAQREFMAIVKSDRRYKADHQFAFSTTIIDQSDL